MPAGAQDGAAVTNSSAPPVTLLNSPGSVVLLLMSMIEACAAGTPTARTNMPKPNPKLRKPLADNILNSPLCLIYRKESCDHSLTKGSEYRYFYIAIDNISTVAIMAICRT